MAQQHELTSADFDIFRERVLAHMRELGMIDWAAGFEWMEGAGTTALAQVITSVPDRMALFQLNPHWTEQPTQQRLRRAAYHEVLEVLLSPLRCLAFDDDLPSDSRTRLLNAEAHCIIRRLEYLTYGPSDDSKASV